MDMTPTHTTSNSTKSPEPDSETPTRAIPVKPVSFTNGVLKRHPPLHHHSAAVVTYRECQKNHAASMGGHALDGCGEFMPSPEATATDPTTIKCAACGCHRNFHRREPEDAPPTPIAATHIIEYQPHHRHHPPPPPPPRSPSSASPPPISSSYYPHPHAAAAAPHVLLALSTAAATETAHLPSGAMIGPSSSRKRFRTKFSQSQKDRMFEFAERVAWKIQKRDEELIREFCNEIGVERGVLKVWMHNNKNTLGKKLPENNNGNNSSGGGHPDSYPSSSGGGASDVVPIVKSELNGGGERSGGSGGHHHHHLLHLHHGGHGHGHGHHVGTNGSSSSS